MLAGCYIASKKQEYADRKDILDSMIVDIRQKNQQSYELITSMQEVVANHKREINELNKQYQRGVITKSQLQSEIEKVKKRRDEINNTTVKATAQLLVFISAKEKYEEEYPNANTINLEDEIKILRTNIDNMREISKKLSDPILG
jgi:chromosome segregation ATPase